MKSAQLLNIVRLLFAKFELILKAVMMSLFSFGNIYNFNVLFLRTILILIYNHAISKKNKGKFPMNCESIEIKGIVQLVTE